MGETLSNLYAVTLKRECLNLAQRFDKKWFFDPLAAHRDELKGLHVNTHIPQVIAAARLYELTGDKRYWNIADYFWNEVTSERAIAQEVPAILSRGERNRVSFRLNLVPTPPKIVAHTT